jgi:hypothetical protein
VLKNAKVIRKAAPHIIPPEEPLEGFRSLVPVDIDVKNTRYNNDTLQSWVNSILDQNHLPSDSSCVIILNPLGMTNTDGDRADRIGGYHDQANAPYCFVNLSGTGLTVSDTQDFYADTLSHEIAEMTCDPDVSIFNDEVCDGCAGNCNNYSWLNFFVVDPSSLPAAYIKSSKDWPPAFPFTFFIASITARSHADDCPAPDNACAYGINDGNFTVDPGTAVTALSRSQDHIDLFVTGTDGGVYSVYWDAASSWASSWSRIREGLAKPGSLVTAVARNPDHLDLFVTGTDGGIYSIYWDDASGWASSWFRIGDGVAELGSPITAVARNPDHLDLFVTGTDGGIYSIYWDANSGWPNSWFRL